MKTAALLSALALALVSATQAEAAPKLSGWWPLDENGGQVAHDVSGDANNGAIIGPARWSPGFFGSALSFDGSTARVRVPDDPTLEPRSAVTVAAWVKATGPEDNYQYIVAKGDWGCLTGSYGLYTGPNAGLMFYVARNQGLSTTRSPDAGTGVWDGNWHLAVGTYDGTAVRLYVDGKQIGNGTPAAGPLAYGLPTGNDLFIGHYDGCPNLDFTGTIDEPQVWNGAFTSSDVATSYANLLELRAGAPAAPPAPQSPFAPPQAVLQPVSSSQSTSTPGLISLTGPAAHTVSQLSISGLSARKPRLGFRLHVGSRAARIKNFALVLPTGLRFARRPEQIRAGIKIAHAGSFRVAIRGQKMLITLATPSRRLTVAIRPPAIVETAALAKHVHAIAQFNRGAKHVTKKVLRLKLTLSLTDTTRRVAPVRAVVVVDH